MLKRHFYGYLYHYLYYYILRLDYPSIMFSVSISRPFNWGMYKKAANTVFLQVNGSEES
jgi:hypothetical protein